MLLLFFLSMTDEAVAATLTRDDATFKKQQGDKKREFTADHTQVKYLRVTTTIGGWMHDKEAH